MPLSDSKSNVPQIVQSLVGLPEEDHHPRESGRLSVDQQSLFTVDLDLYQKLRIIGTGDVGTVYLVRHKETGLLYALKVMSKAEMIKRNKIQRVLTEREILATAAFPFILTLHGSFQDETSLYLLIDWAPGGEFYRILQRMPGRRFSEQTAKFYAAEIVLALEYLHSMGVVYRDLKPENILLQANGHVCLADFDLSKVIPSQPQKMRLSPKRRIRFNFRDGFTREHSFDIINTGASTFANQTNSFVGTAEYLAPEVIQGVGHGPAVDWWCLGVLIYEMLTGQAPFGTSRKLTRQQLFNNICDVQLTWPDDVSVSREAKSIVRKLLNPNPEERLGAKHGAPDVKRSSWFRKTDFDSISEAAPPLQPAAIDPSSITPDPSLQRPWQELAAAQRGRKDGVHATHIVVGIPADAPGSKVDPFAAFGCTTPASNEGSNECSVEASLEARAPTPLTIEVPGVTTALSENNATTSSSTGLQPSN